MTQGNRALKWVLLAACLTPAVAQTEIQSVSYRLRIGNAPERLAEPPVQMNAESLDELRKWDQFAVKAIARAVQGEARLDSVLPLFMTLLRAGPFAGTYGVDVPIDPFLEARARRLLDAAARMASRPPAHLIRELLSDAELVAALRGDATGTARGGGDLVFTKYLGPAGGTVACARFLPLLLATRNHIAEHELVGRCMLQLDRGSVSSDVATLLARTWLWDLRLYLLTRPTAADLAAALALDDDRLWPDISREASAMHLRYFLFGGREGKGAAERWDALDADRFIHERPGFEWVGQAAALAHEVHNGAVLTIIGPGGLELGKSEISLPGEYLIGPGHGATYATPVVGEPVKVEPRGEAEIVGHPRTLQLPAAISDGTVPCGLGFSVVGRRAGPKWIQMGYAIYGIELPAVVHVVGVEGEGVQPAVEQPGPRSGLQWEHVSVELVAPPNGYQPGRSVESALAPGVPGPVDSCRRFFEFGDGQHGMEQVITYEVRASGRDDLPPEITHSDPNPRGDAAARAQAIEDARLAVSELLGPGFALVPGSHRVVGRDCWVGRKGEGADGKWYYVLCRGRQTYHRRNTAFVQQRYWDPIIGEQSIYDTAKIEPDTVSVAQAVLSALRVVGPGAPAQPAASAWAADEAVKYLAEVRGILQEDANLVARTDLVAAAWKQRRIDAETAAKSVADDIISGYDVLTVRMEALRPGDGNAMALQQSLGASLGIGASASRLIEKGIRNNDDGKLTRGLSLLHSYDAQRQQLRTRTAVLALEYKL